MNSQNYRNQWPFEGCYRVNCIKTQRLTETKVRNETLTQTIDPRFKAIVAAIFIKFLDN